MTSSPAPSSPLEAGADARFIALPDVCFRNGYQLIRLDERSAVFVAETNQFQLSDNAAFAHTDFGFEQGVPPTAMRLIKARNKGLMRMGWIHQPRLVLFQPIIRSVIAADFLDTAINLMLREIDSFSRKLRANGVWHG